MNVLPLVSATASSALNSAHSSLFGFCNQPQTHQRLADWSCVVAQIIANCRCPRRRNPTPSIWRFKPPPPILYGLSKYYVFGLSDRLCVRPVRMCIAVSLYVSPCAGLSARIFSKLHIQDFTIFLMHVDCGPLTWANIFQPHNGSRRIRNATREGRLPRLLIKKIYRPRLLRRKYLCLNSDLKSKPQKAAAMLGLGLGLRPQNSGVRVGHGLGLALGGLGLNAAALALRVKSLLWPWLMLYVTVH